MFSSDLHLSARGNIAWIKNRVIKLCTRSGYRFIIGSYWFLSLKSIATVRSVGASTRIEESKLSDQEVDVLLKNMDISKLEERDQQEVVGYFEVLDLIEIFRKL